MAISREYYIQLKAKDEMSKTLNNISSMFANLRKQIDLNTSAYKQFVTTVNTSVIKLPQEISKSMTTVNREVSKSFGETNKNLDSSGNKIDNLNRKTRTMFSNLNVGTTDFSRKLTTMYGLIDTIIISLGVAFYAPVKAASSYEDAMLELKRTLNMDKINASEINKLKKAFILSKGMGSFEELTKIAAVSSKQGIQNIDALIETTQVFAKITNALDMSVEKIQKPLLAIIKLNERERGNKEMFSGPNLMKYADILAHLENELPKVDVPGLTEIWQRSVKTFNKLKLTTEEQAAISSVMLQRGVNVSTAASEIRMFVNRFRHVYDQTGLDLRDIIINHSKGSLEGLKDALKLIEREFGGPKGHMRQHKIFGSLGIKFLGTMKGAFEDLDYAMLKVKESKGAVDREFKEFIKTFTATLADFKKSFRSLFAVIGTPMIKILGPVMKTISGVLDQFTMFLINYPNLAKALGSVTLAFSALIVVGVSLMFTLKLFTISLISVKLILKGLLFPLTMVKTLFSGLYSATGFAINGIVMFMTHLKRLPIILYMTSTATSVLATVMKGLSYSLPMLGKYFAVISGLIYAITYLYNTEMFQKITQMLASVLTGTLNLFKSAFSGFINYLNSGFSALTSILGTVYDYVGWIANKIGTVINWFGKKLTWDDLLKKSSEDVSLSVIVGSQNLKQFKKDIAQLEGEDEKKFKEKLQILKYSVQFPDKDRYKLSPEAKNVLRAGLLDLVERKKNKSYISTGIDPYKPEIVQSLKKLGVSKVSELISMPQDQAIKKLQILNKVEKQTLKDPLKTLTKPKNLSSLKVPTFKPTPIKLPESTKLSNIEKRVEKSSDTTKQLLNELKSIKQVILNQSKIDEAILREAKNNNENVETLSLYDRSKFGLKMRDFNLAEV